MFELSTNAVIYIGTGLIAGFLAGIILMLFVVQNLKKEQSLLKRKYEKTSVGADDSELRVKTLENKIKTLEAALEKSLKKD
ncbi:MAG: hypothetical protein OSJ27_07720 [Candidatus Gastranaerophilales bacterium]|nr:hypothetical protein [Candidatus Gastranaerophilales bacterium]